MRPVVLIGDNGLSEAVLKEIDLALTSHGLIKVR
ncbi:YhbY family RNA-binding protein, partial [Achromobacter xylosoxidans]